MKEPTKLTGARQEVYEETLSISALPHTLQNLKEIRDMALVAATFPDKLMWDPEEFSIFQELITLLEELYYMHLADESEITRHRLPRKQRRPLPPTL